MRRRRRPDTGIPLRAVVPNAVTAAALCFGLTGIRFAIAADWDRAVLMILIAGVLDGIDGRIARMMGGESRFGAELDSLSDSISFGVSPAVIMYLWALIEVPKLGWMIALLYAAFTALRLARFNARIDAADQPHKSAGFLTGVPAPAGAALAGLEVLLENYGLPCGQRRQCDGQQDCGGACDHHVGFLVRCHLHYRIGRRVGGHVLAALLAASWCASRLND